MEIRVICKLSPWRSRGALAVLVVCASVVDTTAEAATPVCAPLRIEPTTLRVPTLGAAQLHAVGGSRTAVFALEGDARGAEIEPGGGLRASAQAGALTVVARDGLCNAEARAQVEVVGPFVVEPREITIAPRATLQFVSRGAIGDVTYAVLDAATARGAAATVDAKGKLVAGDAEGTYHLVARDGSGREARLAVTVGKPVPLRARAPFVAVPIGGRVRLDWRGGSGVVDVVSASAGAATRGGDAIFFDAGAKSGFADVTVVDRFTKEQARVRVLVGDVLGAASTVRGTQTGAGDMASGDVNGDGIADLIVGHAERSKTAFEAGGILVYYGKVDGTFGDPDALEGDHPGDHYGSVLVVRDVNGDGIDDVVSGVPEEDIGESKRGEVSIFLGAKGGLERDADRVLSGEAANHRFGSAVAVADLTGDGAPEIVASASGARSPFQMGCDGGRVYVYRNDAKPRGVVATIPWQVIDIRDTLSDDPEAPVACAPTPLGGGRALALVDMDGDRALDLVVGAPVASFPQPGRSHGSVLVYRGASDGKFDAEPSWAIHLDPAARLDGAAFGGALDVVPGGATPLLVVRSQSYQPAGAKGQGALWVFAPGSLGAPPASGSHKVKNVTTKVARLLLAPDGARGWGRSATVADVDPRAGLEYVVGAAQAGAPGGAYVYSAGDLAAAAFAPIAKLAPPGADLLGFRVAALRGRELAGLALWAPWRTTARGPFVGAVDYVPPGAAAATSRWASHATIALPNFGASDRAGATVQLAALERGAAPLAIVGAPGAHSPAHAGHAAGEKLRTGVVDVFGASPTEPLARAFADRQDAQLGGAAVVALDFDGDGVMELAVGDSGEAAGGVATGAVVDPDGCSPLDAKGSPVSVGGRGVVHLYGLGGAGASAQLVEKFRVTAPKETRVEKGMAPYARNRFGFAIAAADVNGDGKDDLVVGRPGGRDSSGAEVVLGRAAVSGKTLVACSAGDKGPMGATVFAPATEAEPVHYGFAVAKVGDLDKDGCDETAFAMRNAAVPNAGPLRSGIAVAFGYDATGARCRGHRTPFVVRVVADDHPLADNVAGDVKKRFDDLNDLAGAPTFMGAVLARGAGDFTGDGVPDLVFRDADLAMFERRGPAVEIVSGAMLATLCPNRACPKGHAGSFWSDGDWNVLGLRPLGAPSRRVMLPGGVTRGFGASIALGDVSGDGVADLAIGTSDDTDAGAFAGELRVFLGGAATSSQEALAGDPWLIAVGDSGERGAFGASVSLASAKGGGVLLVGAPQSSRAHTGGAIGAAYRFTIEVSK